MSAFLRDRRANKVDDLTDYGILKDRARRKLSQQPKQQPSARELEIRERALRWNATTQSRSRFGVRRFIRNQIYLLIYTILHAIFSLYIRTRKAWHLVSYRIASILFYHHRTPALIARDVKDLIKKPHHLSVILKRDDERATDLEKLIGEASDIAVWSACAGVPMLSIYEKTGILKKYMPQIQHAIVQKFAAYFGSSHPGLSVAAPHSATLESPATGSFADDGSHDLQVLLISYPDGRESIVELTRTLAEMSQRSKLSPVDIRINVIDEALSEEIMTEPDLLLLFTPHVELSGYPPWQVRLTEIFCLQDNRGVGYQVFLRGLRNFSHAQMRKGR